MKRIYTILLLLVMGLINITPNFAFADVQYFDYNNGEPEEETTTLVTSLEEEKVYLDPKTIYKLEFESDLDINETKPDEEIYFRLGSQVKLSNGMYLPEHTRFAGKFKKVLPSKPLFKRARAYIIVDKILMPNEKTYTVRMEPKSGSDLKSPQILNFFRAIPASVGILGASVVSAVVVVVESVSVVGLVIVPRTCRGFGILISSMAKGLNYKVKAGSTIEFKLDTPVYVTVSDLQK